MIFSVAEAEVADADSHHLMRAWSNLVVGERPEGIVDCYLLRGEGAWQVASVWESAESFDRALREERTHPAYVVFEAAGLDMDHTTMEVTGHLTGGF